MLTPKNKRYLRQIFPFGVILMTFSITYALLEKGILGDHPIYPSTGNPYRFTFFVPTVLSTLSGFIFGSFEVLYVSKWFKNHSFLKKLILKTSIYFLIITTTTLFISNLTNAYAMGASPLSKQVLDTSIAFVCNFTFWSISLYFTTGVIVCLFYAEVSDYIGQAVLFNFFTGKYHHPIEEERIFMFVDMKSSTTIAEKLGHTTYFKMLKEYYEDLSDPIIQYGGEIYQYVGDEVIVTWKLKKDKNNNDCIHCFFAMKNALTKRANEYQSKYGLVPGFKTGIHLGRVTSGEIGVIKKEITFSGDVINTTARIQALCNTFQVDLLTTEALIDTLELDSSFQKQALGNTELRGKNKKINLFTIEKLSIP